MRRIRRFAAAALAVALVAGCGDGDPYGTTVVSVGVGVSVPAGPPPVAGLGLWLTRVGPEAVRLDWSLDPHAAGYDVWRDGYLLATVSASSLVDASGVIGDRYCYQVVGRDPYGRTVASTSVGCVTLF